MSPAISGLLRPTLYLPRDFSARFSSEQRRLVLAHELAHWQRGDLHSNFAAFLLLSVFWFHPLVWLGYRRYRMDQELACDAQVLSKTSPAAQASYGRALLLAACPAQSAWSLVDPLTNHYGAYKKMKERLQNLTQSKSFTRLPLAVLSLVVFAAAMLWQSPTVASETGNESDLATPIVRVNPQYPAVAAEQGLREKSHCGLVLLRQVRLMQLKSSTQNQKECLIALRLRHWKNGAITRVLRVMATKCYWRLRWSKRGSYDLT